MNTLVVIDTLTPAVLTEPGGIEAILSKIETGVRLIDTDISTPAARAAVKSLVRKIASSKVAFDGAGKELAAEWKAKAKLIDVERAKVWDRLEALQAEVRQPLTDWEGAEKARIAGHQNEIQRLIDMAALTAERPTAAEVSERLAVLEATPKRDWQEFAKPAETARSEAFSKLTVLKAAAVKFEAEQAELARLRAEQAAREQKERDDRIAAEAAEQARLVAEAKAAREAKEAADRAENERRQVEQERADAVARAEKAERDAKEAAEKAERDRKAAEVKAESDRVAAIDAERRRVAAEAEAAAAEVAKREANTRHRNKIHREIIAKFCARGFSEIEANNIVSWLKDGEVPHVSIAY